MLLGAKITLLRLSMTAVLILLLGVGGCGGGGGGGSNTLFSEGFEVYALADPWTPEGGWAVSNGHGTWSIEDDGGTQVLGYVADPATGADFLSYGSEAWTDCSFRVRVKINAGVDYAGILRNNGGNYYMFDINDGSGNNAALFKSAGSLVLATGSYVVANGTWYTIKMVFSGQNIKCYINGTQVIDYTDLTMVAPFTSGTVALMADDDRLTSGRRAKFDNVSVALP